MMLSISCCQLGHRAGVLNSASGSWHPMAELAQDIILLVYQMHLVLLAVLTMILYCSEEPLHSPAVSIVVLELDIHVHNKIIKNNHEYILQSHKKLTYQGKGRVWSTF